MRDSLFTIQINVKKLNIIKRIIFSKKYAGKLTGVAPANATDN